MRILVKCKTTNFAGCAEEKQKQKQKRNSTWPACHPYLVSQLATSNNARCDCNGNPPWLCSALNHLSVPSFLLPPLLPIEPKVATRAKSLPRSSRPDSQWRRRRRRTRRSGPFPVLSPDSAASSSPVPLNLQLHPHKVHPKKSRFSTRGPHTAATCSSTARPPPSSLPPPPSNSPCLAHSIVLPLFHPFTPTRPSFPTTPSSPTPSLTIRCQLTPANAS